MTRFFVTCAFMFAAIIAFDASAGTTDVHIRGAGSVIKLKSYMRKAKCPECQSLLDAYNDTMSSIEGLEDWIEDIEDELDDNNDRDGRHHRQDAPQDTGAGMSDDDKKEASEQMNYRIMLDEMAEKIPEMDAQMERLEKLAADLQAQLQQCEATMCVGEGGRGGGEQIGGGTTTYMPLPFDWAGPYPSPCLKCDKLAARLNELPNMTREAMARLESAKAEKMQAEMRILEIRGEHVGFGKKEETAGDRARTERATADSIEAVEEWKKRAEKDIKAAEKDLDALKKNFDETLKLYNDCVKTCPKQTGMTDPEKTDDTAFVLGGDYSKDMKGCTLGYEPQGFMIGANGTYGTGAQMKDKAKGMAMGALGSAIGGLGGGGFSLGGGGRANEDVGSPGGGSSGPKTYKDPTRGDWFQGQFGDINLGTRASYEDGALTVSQKIFDSPGGASTFHAMWAEDGKGRKLLPTKYFIYSLYVDHKLTIWWTYDHWTDGVHDGHDEGSESTTWRTNLGDFRVRYSGDEGVQNSMWYQSGFNTAVKGVRTVGAEFPVTPGDLTGCGLNIVTHVTMPKQDPVVTIPVVNRLFTDRDKNKDARNLIIQVTPAIIGDSREN